MVDQVAQLRGGGLANVAFMVHAPVKGALQRRQVVEIGSDGREEGWRLDPTLYARQIVPGPLPVTAPAGSWPAARHDSSQTILTVLWYGRFMNRAYDAMDCSGSLRPQPIVQGYQQRTDEYVSGRSRHRR